MLNSVPSHADAWGTGGTAPRIFNLGIRWEVSGSLHAPTDLPRGKEIPTNIWQRAEWTLEPFWKRWRRKSPYPSWESSPIRPARTQSLYWLSYPGSWIRMYFISNDYCTGAKYVLRHTVLKLIVPNFGHRICETTQFHTPEETCSRM
jgi:hypothetical protein